MTHATQHNPLANRRVVVVCSARKSASLLQALTSMGGDVLHVEVVAIGEIEDKAAVHSALARLDAYSWIIFTSSYGVEFFSRYMDEYGVSPALRGRLRICAIGPATAATALQSGFDVAVVGEDFVAEGVLNALAEQHGGLEHLSGMRILLPRAKEARDVIPRELAEAGAIVDVVPCYQTAPARVDAATLNQLKNRAPDLIVFTSSSMVTNFVRALDCPDEAIKMMNRAVVAALGPITAGTVESYGKRCDIVPSENTIPSLLQAVAEYFR